MNNIDKGEKIIFKQIIKIKYNSLNIIIEEML